MLAVFGILPPLSIVPYSLKMFRLSQLLMALTFILAALVTPLFSQPLPRIALSNAFPGTTFELPVGLVESPDGSGRFFIVGQNGIITVVHKDTDGKGAKEFLNISDRQPHVAVEDGLLGLAFHPGFKTNLLFYIYYTQANPLRTILSEIKVSANDPNRADLKTERVVMEIPQPFSDHKAGQLKFGPDGFLYIGLGDGGRGNDPFNNGQNTAVLLGKILRIDVNTRSQMMVGGREQPLGYGIPANNPFVNEPERYEYGVRREIWAYGLRNPWRFSFDRQTGDLWAGDVGQDSWEEIDLIVPGGNYGWCVREGSHHFKPGPANASYNEPIMEYPHTPQLLAQSRFPQHSIGSCVIGGYVYRGKKYPSLNGVYVYADYVLGTFWGLRQRDGKVIESGTLLEQPKNVTSFGEDSDGELYAATYDGHIFHIIVPGD
jgi:glucose/arabinose dehydrogenase